jgi:hypothetical protein
MVIEWEGTHCEEGVVWVEELDGHLMAFGNNLHVN